MYAIVLDENLLCCKTNEINLLLSTCSNLNINCVESSVTFWFNPVQCKN